MRFVKCPVRYNTRSVTTNIKISVFSAAKFQVKGSTLQGHPTKGRGGGKGTLGISGWGCAAGTLEPLAYTKASFSWIFLPYSRVNSPNHSYPRVAVFQKLRSLAQYKPDPQYYQKRAF